MLSRDKPFKDSDNDKDFDLMFYDHETFLRTMLINTVCEMYGYYSTCAKAEEVFRKIINEAKRIYLESEEV